MAARDAFDGQPATAQGTVFFNGFDRVAGAAGREAAMVAEEGAEQHLVGSDQKLEKFRHGSIWRKKGRLNEVKLAVRPKFSYNTAISFASGNPF